MEEHSKESLAAMFFESDHGASTAMAWCSVLGILLDGVDLPLLATKMPHMQGIEAVRGALCHVAASIFPLDTPFAELKSTVDECIAASCFPEERMFTYGGDPMYMLYVFIYAYNTRDANDLVVTATPLLLQNIFEGRLVGVELYCTIVALCFHVLCRHFDIAATMLAAMYNVHNEHALEAVIGLVNGVSLLDSSDAEMHLTPMGVSSAPYSVVRRLTTGLLRFAETSAKALNCLERLAARVYDRHNVQLDTMFFGSERQFSVTPRFLVLYREGDVHGMVSQIASNCKSGYRPLEDECALAIAGCMNTDCDPECVLLQSMLHVAACIYPLFVADLLCTKNAVSTRLAAIPVIFGEIVYMWSQHVISSDSLMALIPHNQELLLRPVMGTTIDKMVVFITDSMLCNMAHHDLIGRIYIKLVDANPSLAGLSAMDSIGKRLGVAIPGQTGVF